MSNDNAAAVSKKKVSSGFHFIAGLGSGVSSAFLLQPADLLKTRVQQSQTKTTLRQALRAILDGPQPVRQLWRGTVPSMIRTGGGSALYFGMLNQMRQYVTRMPGVVPIPVPIGSSLKPAVQQQQQQQHSSVLPKLSNIANLSTGALARVVAGFMLNPVTVLKVRYESTQYAYTSMFGAARDVLAKEGLPGFFAGFGATAVRDAPYAGLYVVLYEQAKTRLGALTQVVINAAPSQADRSVTSSASINFVSGVIAAVSATALTNPFDAIKTRLQLNPTKYRNMFQTATIMLRNEGVQSMFYGLSLRVGRKAISSALTWTVYEEVIRRAERAIV